MLVNKTDVIVVFLIVFFVFKEYCETEDCRSGDCELLRLPNGSIEKKCHCPKVNFLVYVCL
jgi:hypothetical protein